jgi:hypothetical protein
VTPDPVEMIPLGNRPSWPARQASLAMATRCGFARDAVGEGSVELDAARWFMARARRQLREALWADHARATGMVRS